MATEATSKVRAYLNELLRKQKKGTIWINIAFRTNHSEMIFQESFPFMYLGARSADNRKK